MSAYSTWRADLKSRNLWDKRDNYRKELEVLRKKEAKAAGKTKPAATATKPEAAPAPAAPESTVSGKTSAGVLKEIGEVHEALKLVYAKEEELLKRLAALSK
jgi:hypothetical protein